MMENFRHSSDNAGDFRHAAGERETRLKCGCHPRDAGDLAGLVHKMLGDLSAHACNLTLLPLFNA